MQYSEGDIVMMRWRIGDRERGTHSVIYAMVGSTPSDKDVTVGFMGSELLAANAVNAHNSILVNQGVLNG